MADIKQKKIKINWRGYYSFVDPNLPPFTKMVLREKIAEALLHIKLPTDEEREVLITLDDIIMFIMALIL